MNISEYNTGLSEDYLHQMQSVFVRYPHLMKVILFGSRAMGTQKEMSDVDLALVFSNDENEETSHIQYQLEEDTTIPLFFDVLNSATISSPELQEHIHLHGITLYEAMSE